MPRQEVQIRIKDKRGGRFIVDDIALNGYGKALGPYGIAIYIALCRHANMRTQQCWPSHKTMADKTGMSVAQVKRMLDKIEKLKLISRETEIGKFTIYTLLEPKEKHYKADVAQVDPAQGELPPSSGGATTQLPQSYKGTKEGTKEGTNISMSNSIKEIYEHYLKCFGRTGRYKLSQSRKDKLKKRLTEFNAEEIKKAITNASEDDFYSGGGDRGWIADIDYITRNYENLERLLNLKPRKGGKRGQYKSSNQPKAGKYDDVVER